jgi:hypothetical protein
MTLPTTLPEAAEWLGSLAARDWWLAGLGLVVVVEAVAVFLLIVWVIRRARG